MTEPAALGLIGWHKRNPTLSHAVPPSHQPLTILEDNFPMPNSVTECKSFVCRSSRFPKFASANR
jgi:hypothetical protein